MGYDFIGWNNFRKKVGIFHHEQIFFEDEEGGNIGFRSAGNPIFADGEFFEETDPSIISKDADGKHYDDSIMRKAVEEVKQSFDLKYCLWSNNCQDFTQSVREQFQEIIKQAN